MSKDLISRSELLGRIYEMQKFNILDSVDEAEIVTLITSMPTAYDPDEVLEQLEDHLFEKYCIEGADNKFTEIVYGGYAVPKGNMNDVQDCKGGFYEEIIAFEE